MNRDKYGIFIRYRKGGYTEKLKLITLSGVFQYANLKRNMKIVSSDKGIIEF